MILLRASARKFHDFSLFMTHNSHSPARDSAETLYESIEIEHTDKVGRTQTSEFLFFWEELRRMPRWVPIHSVPILRKRTVCTYVRMFMFDKCVHSSIQMVVASVWRAVSSAINNVECKQGVSCRVQVSGLDLKAQGVEEDGERAVA